MGTNKTTEVRGAGGNLRLRDVERNLTQAVHNYFYGRTDIHMIMVTEPYDQIITQNTSTNPMLQLYVVFHDATTFSMNIDIYHLWQGFEMMLPLVCIEVQFRLEYIIEEALRNCNLNKYCKTVANVRQ